MRKLFLMFTLAASLMSCGSNENDSAAGENKNSDVTKNPDYQKGLALIAKNDCLSCHKVADKLIGPAYTEIAKKHDGQEGVVDSLAQRIIQGSVGHWGSIPMTAHPALSQEDARSMVKYILTLNQ